MNSFNLYSGMQITMRALALAIKSRIRLRSSANARIRNAEKRKETPKVLRYTYPLVKDRKGAADK